MKCYYEILNISKDADLTEIKSNYRKFALKWHPDKNLDNTELAKEQFQLVQQAYEVLSDPQERAWYDKHREQILRGSNSQFQDNSLDLFQYFTTSCFKGYGDDEKGFYAIYKHVFDQIIKEDLEFIDDREELDQIPRFGHSQSDYDDVVGTFYSYWSSYSTKKSFVWLDPYSIQETRDRRVLKFFEKENKKVRQKARKERNEEVRNLVAFVRKRDKRVQEHNKLMEAKIQLNRQKQEELKEMKRLERKRELNECGEQAEWAKFENVESELEQIEKHLAQQFGDEFSNSDDESDDDLYCIGCNKIFKTSKAFKNHESSKKHRDNVKLLKATMVEDEIDDPQTTETENNLELDRNQSNSESDEEELDIKQSDEDIDSRTKKNRKKNKNVLTVTDDDDLRGNHELIHLEQSIDSDDNFNFDSSKNQKKNLKKNKKSSHDKSQPVKSNETKKRNKKEKGENGLQVDFNHCCITCKSEFSSKNKLFDHLKKTGHGVYLPTSNSKNKTKKKL